MNLTIQDGIGNAFVDLLNIVSSVAIRFHQAVHGTHTSVIVDVHATFGSLIDSYRAQVSRVAYEMWAARLERANVLEGPSVKTLQRWLGPQDSVLSFLSSNHVNLVNQPEEYTCVWFQKHLLSFLRGNQKIMTIDGKTGAGKSTLAHWVTDRLQRPIGRKTVSTISFSFNQSIPAQSTSLALIKTLLYQLLEQRIGDVRVYRAVRRAFDQLQKSSDVGKHEETLWEAFGQALKAINAEDDDNESNVDMLVVVIDGIDEIRGQKKAAVPICKKLQDLAQRFEIMRLIQFSEPLEMTVPHSTHLTLSADQTADDLRTLLQKSLSNHSSFLEQSEVEQEKMIDRLASAADGSLLWAGLASHYIRIQKTTASMLQAYEGLLLTPRSVSDAVQKLLASMQLNQDSKNLISWLAAAERPLTFSEIGLLQQAHIEKGILIERKVDVEALVPSVKPFVVIGEGLVTLRHLQIKHALVNIANTSKLSLQITERQRDLLTRLLIYTKSCIKNEGDITFSSWEISSAESRFRSYQLLEYAVRYWTVHFRKSSWFKSSGELNLSGYVKDIFPATATLSILEKTCWDASPFLTDSLEMHLLAFRVRQAVFGQSHLCVLQTTISCSILLESLSRTTEAVTYCALGSKLSRALLGVQSEITTTCCTWLLRISETSITKQRTQIMTYREEVYKLLVESYKHRYGASSKQVLEIYKKLAEFYTFISEETRATEIYEVVRQITVKIYGEHSEETRTVCGYMGVKLRHHEHVQELDTFEGSLFTDFEGEIVEEFTIIYVNRLIELAVTHITAGRFAAAEELYIELWLKLTEHCRSVDVLEWHEKKIQVMLTYARFLESRKRISESSSVLLCVWREYEFHAFSAVESVIMQLKEVAILMKKVSLLNVALSVFKKCWSFFKSTHKEQTTIFKELEEHITHTSKTIIETTSKTTTTSSSETVIREVFESSMSSSSTTEISSTTIELCQSLSSIYVKEERYSEAIKCVKSVLKKSWSSFFSSSVESVTLSSSISSTTIDLVMQMALCYLKQSRLDKCEQVYVRLYRAVRSSRRVDDALCIKFSQTLLEFYTSHKLYSKAISFYQELLVEYRAFYGASHSITIKTLYALGDLCRLHNRTHSYWIEYFLEICHSLNKGSVVCHRDASRALVIVAECYFEDCRYSESLEFYKVIATTFFKHGLEYEYFKQTTEVQMIFEHYERSLIESKTEISVQISLLKEYRESCVRHFGASAAITISATLQYASVCTKSESHQHESMSLYEHVMKHSSSTEIVTRCKTTLRSLYVKQITSTKTSTTVTQTMLETATTLMYERYSEIRKTHSCTHETTLSCLKELISLYYKQSKVEIAVKELRSFIVQCITEITETKALIETARHVAEVYRSCGYFEHAHVLIRELKMQVVFKSGVNVGKVGFNVTQLSRSVFAFIASFECHILVEQSLTVTELMAELVAQSLYFERYSQAIKSKSKIDVVFASASKLRRILSKRKRVDFYWTIEREVFEYFTSTETRVAGFTSASAVKMFVTLLLEHFGEHKQSRNFVATAGYAATARIRLLLEQHKFKDAFELCKCIYKFLMEHEGLDDPTEISQGFTLCLMMAGRGYGRCPDATLHKSMLELSRQILGEVLDICKNSKINLARCKIEDLNELICLMGEQQDYKNLHFLLNQLWHTREAQTKWSQTQKLALAKRLIQASFAAGFTAQAIHLAEDIRYNVRRVQGSRSPGALEFYDLLSRLYTSAAVQLQHKDDKAAKDQARSHFKKAMTLHEDVLKLFVDASDDSDEDDDASDFASDMGSAPGSPAASKVFGCGQSYLDEKQQREAVASRLRLLKLAYQRLGGWNKNAFEFEGLTNTVWSVYGESLKVQKKDVLAREWSMQGFGNGKAESRDDEFIAPGEWTIL